MSTASRSTRREFLLGKAATEALADVARSTFADVEFPEPARESYLVKLSRRAMACEFEIFLNAGQYPQGTEVALGF